MPYKPSFCQQHGTLGVTLKLRISESAKANLPTANMTMDNPNLGANAFYLSCQAVMLIPQLFLGIRCKTWGYLFGMGCGHVLEIIGYLARIQIHYGHDQFTM